MINSVKTPVYNNSQVQSWRPIPGRNYCLFDEKKADYFVKQGDKALPAVADILSKSNDEYQITETLYIANKMIDNGTKGFDKLYPYFARFNNTVSPNIQSFLAGIYRKTQVPDAFGPLAGMLIRNSLTPRQNQTVDPNEEIGGALLSYISEKFRK